MIWPACLVNEKNPAEMAVELDASQYLLLEEISDVFKSFQNGLTNRWAIFLSNKTSYGKIVHCPSEILIAEKQEGEEAARKRWATQNVREKHLGDGKETAIDSTPEHFSILQIMTSHPVRQRAIQKRVRVGGLWRDGTKADDIQGGNWSRNCYFAGYNIPANDVCACVRMQWFVLTTLLWMLSTVLCAVLQSY